MTYCSSCGSPINNDTLFCPACGQRVYIVVKVQQNDRLQTPIQQEKKPFKPNSCMGLAIFTTMCCSVIFGLYAAFLANDVDALYYSGQYREAEMKAADAKKWSIIGIVFGIVFNILLIIILIIIGIETDGEIFNYL